MTFWSSWALWEKLCFVLACAIVLTILAGCTKLIHKHFQLRKHTALAAQKKERQQEIKRALSLKRPRGPDVPFGVRAIESGIEVEGVWISRTNTPAPSSPESLRSTEQFPVTGVTTSQHSATASIPMIVMPQPLHPYSSRGNRPNAQSPDSFDSAPSTERLPSRNDSTDHQTQRRTLYRPRQSSHLRFSSQKVASNAETSRQSRASDLSLDESQKHRSSASSSESEIGVATSHYAPRPPRLANGFLRAPYTAVRQTHVDTQPFTQRSYGHLGSLNAHRLSHAAEVGRLSHNRDHSPSTRAEWKALRSTPREPSPNGDFTSAIDTSFLKDPFKTPPLTPIETDPVEPPSFQSFVESDPNYARRQLMPLLNRSGEAAEEFNTGLATTESPLRPARQLQVVRKVNSSFEVLKSGTLDTPEEPSNLAGAENGDRQQFKKLQKRNRAQSGSERVSQFTEQV